ncbi:MAG TPA: hypothetical protein VIV55_10105 [Flavobacterium sp.]
MARYDFTNDSGMLKIVIQSQGGLNLPQSMSLSTPSIELTNNRIKLFDSGKYKTTYVTNDIGLIKGTPFVDMNIAFGALSTLISEVMRTQGGGVLIP